MPNYNSGDLVKFTGKVFDWINPNQSKLWQYLAGLLIIGILSIYQLASAEIVHESGSFRSFIGGMEPDLEYDNWISHISEGIIRPGYNVYAPEELDPQLDGFGSFELLSDNEFGNDVLELFSTLSLCLIFGDTICALSAMDAGPFIDYDIVQFSDSDFGRTYYMLRENLDMDYFDPGLDSTDIDDVTGSFDLGWGLFVFNPAASRPQLIIEVPHPNDDYTAPYIALSAFEILDAGLLMINGAGREVLHSGGVYTNSRSLSDPSRNCFHPFAEVHRSLIDLWRGFGVDELVIQIHSFDNRNRPFYKGNIISAGRYYRLNNVPFYDTGAGSLGLLNNLEQPVFNADHYDFQHQDVDLIDYVSTQSLQEISVDGGIEGEEIWLEIASSLWGYSQSCQEVYSHEGIEDCGSRENWIHIEHDELPILAHEIGENVWYDIDSITVADCSNFENTMEFFGPVYHALAEALDSMAVFEDDLPPTIPRNLQLVNVLPNSISLEWDACASTYFETYELLIDPSGELTDSAEVYDRADFAEFCWAAINNIVVENLGYQVNYAIAIRGVDQQLRTGPLSNTIYAYTNDDIPPTIYPVFNGQTIFWQNLENSDLQFHCQDNYNEIDLSSIEYRLDLNANGSYDFDENWISLGLSGQSSEFEFSFQIVFPTEECLRFELRVHDTESEIWAYSGSDNIAGIVDDFQICNDFTLPESILNAPELGSINGDGKLGLSWNVAAIDSTFSTYRILVADSAFQFAPEAAFIYDKHDYPELGNSDCSGLSLDPQQWAYWDSLFFRLDRQDFAGNLANPSPALSFIYENSDWVSVSDLQIDFVNDLFNLSWDCVESIPGFEVAEYWVYFLEEADSEPQIADRLLLVQEQNCQVEISELNTPSGSGYFIVKALVGPN
jgi:hypothetical protein